MYKKGWCTCKIVFFLLIYTQCLFAILSWRRRLRCPVLPLKVSLAVMRELKKYLLKDTVQPYCAGACATPKLVSFEGFNCRALAWENRRWRVSIQTEFPRGTTKQKHYPARPDLGSNASFFGISALVRRDTSAVFSGYRDSCFDSNYSDEHPRLFHMGAGV